MWKVRRPSETRYGTSSWHCVCGAAAPFFFTLNPHDHHSPLLIYFVGDREEHLERLSLDWNDADMAAYYDRHKAGNALFFHELAVRWPGAAAQCVHWTFEQTLTVLFNLAPPANRKPRQQHWDGIASRCEPGLLACISSYLGIVEPQMRWTEHLHKLVQILGFADPPRVLPPRPPVLSDDGCCVVACVL